MMGTTGLEGLQVDCVVGIHEHERQKPQTVVMNIELDYDFAAAASSDAIADALDYDWVANHVTELLRRRAFQLIETMGEETAAMLLSRLTQLRKVRVEVRKPSAVPAARCAFVRVERIRS